MKFPLIICLISGILLIHAGATISYVFEDITCVSIATGAEEEEESHYTKKISRVETLVSYCGQVNEIALKKNGFYRTSVVCSYESNRIDLPPEL